MAILYSLTAIVGHICQSKTTLTIGRLAYTTTCTLYKDSANPIRDGLFKQTDQDKGLNYNKSSRLEGSDIVKVEYYPPDHKSIVVVSLNAPKSKNALDYEQVTKMTRTLDELKKDSKLKVLILRSLLDEYFSVGANLKERAKMTEDQVERWLVTQRELMDKIHNFPTPTIAAVDGLAFGGGLEYALACDIRIINQKAKVGLTETKWAIIPGAGGTQRLPRLIGPSRAKELIFTARILDGRQAYDLGLADHVVDGHSEASFTKAMELADQMCNQAPLSLRLAKLAINKGTEIDLASGLDFENACYLQLLRTKDRLEGLQAFLEKRKPVYDGK